MFGLRALGALPYTSRPETAVSGALYYKLAFNGSIAQERIVTLPSPLLLSSLAAGASFRIEVDFDLNVIGADHTLLFNASDYSYLRIMPSGIIRAGYLIQSGFNDEVQSSAQSLFVGQKYTLAFDLSETRKIAELWLNGNLIGSVANRWGTFRIKDVGLWVGSSALNGHIYEIRQYQNGVLTGRQSAKNISSGNVLSDDIGSNNMIQSGSWPADNSEWRQYLDTTVSNALVPQPVSGAIKWYLKWPATTGVNNKALVQLSGIGTASYLTLVFAENVIDPNTTGTGAYLCDGRRALNTTDEGNGTYFLEYNNGVQTNGATNFTLNGASSANNAWRTAKAGDAYKFFFDAGLDGVVSVGGRFNQMGGFPLLALRTIIVDDANGSHVIDLTNKAGLTQFTSNDGLITARLFGFNEGECWCPYLDTTVSTPIVNQGVNGVAKSGLDFSGNTTTLQRRIAPFPLPTNYTQDMRIDVTFIHVASSNYQAVLQTPEFSTNNNNFFVGCAPSSVYYFWCNDSQLNSNVTPIAGQEYVISITIDTLKNVGISVNGSAYVYKSYPNLSAALYNQILCGGTTNNLGSFRDPFVGRLKRVETWVGGVKTGDYTNETGAGTTMVNAIGGGVATQAGTWPTDNSEWRQFIVFNAAPQNPDKVVTTMMTTKIRTASPIIAMKVGINSRVTFARSSILFTSTKIVPLAIQTSSRTQSTSVRSKIGLSSGTTRARTKSTNVVYKVTSGAVVTRGRTKTTSSASKVLVKQSQTLGRAKSTFNLQKSALVAVLVKTKGLSTTAQSKSTQVGGSSRSVVFSTAQAKKSINSSALSLAFTSAEASAMKGAIVAGFSVAKALAEFTYFNPANAIPPKFISISTNATTTFDLSTSAHLTTTIITLRKTTHDY